MSHSMEWDPTQFFRSDKDRPPRIPYAILVLNQPINDSAFAAIRKHGMYCTC
jgi:thiamine pyrophosphokinase